MFAVAWFSSFQAKANIDGAWYECPLGVRSGHRRHAVDMSASALNADV